MLPLRTVPSQIRSLSHAARNRRLPCGLHGQGVGARGLEARGLRHNPAGQEYNRHRLKPPLEDVSNRDLAKNFADFLAERQAGQPFCFWLGTTEPHRTYERDSGIRAGAIRPTSSYLPICLTTTWYAVTCWITPGKSNGETSNSAARSRSWKLPAS